MTIENQRNKKNAHLGEALGKYLPPLTLREFTKYLEESKGSKFEDEASRHSYYCHNRFLQKLM